MDTIRPAFVEMGKDKVNGMKKHAEKKPFEIACSFLKHILKCLSNVSLKEGLFGLYRKVLIINDIFNKMS